jgi:type II secretory pathway component PulF
MTVAIGLIYPLIVLLIACGLFTFSVTKTVPVVFKVLADVSRGGPQWEQTAAWLAGTSHIWGPIIPAAVLLWLGFVWWRSGRVASGYDVHPAMNWGVLGSFQRLQYAGRMASLTELLSLLIASDVPLDEAVSLASAAVGSQRMRRGGEDLAERIRRGESGGKPPAGFSPLLAWTLIGQQPQGRLVAILRRMSQTYRDEFLRRSQWLAIYIPLVTTAFVAGSLVVLYAAVNLGPWIIILNRLANPLVNSLS